MDIELTASDQALSQREVAIIHALIQEGSVPKAAQQVGLSERHTRRILNNLQKRLGEPNNIALALRVARIYPP